MIKPTELLRNADGSMYHLNLLAEEVSDKVILVGDPARADIVAGFFDSVETEKEKREFYTRTGYYKDKRLSVISTGIGTDNIDIVINELDALFNINSETLEIVDPLRRLKIIRIGTCGALQESLSPGEGVLSTHAIGFDNLMSFYKTKYISEEKELMQKIGSHFMKNGLNIPFYVFKGDSELTAQFSTVFKGGMTVTCPGFYGPQGRSLRMQAKYPAMIEILSSFQSDIGSIVNFEMETSAIFGMSRMLGHQATTVDLVIANRLTQEALTDYSEELEKMIKKVLVLI